MSKADEANQPPPAYSQASAPGPGGYPQQPGGGAPPPPPGYPTQYGQQHPPAGGQQYPAPGPVPVGQREFFRYIQKKGPIKYKNVNMVETVLQKEGRRGPLIIYLCVNICPCLFSHILETVVVTQPGAVIWNQAFRETPVTMNCPHCQAHITTGTHYQTGTLTWIVCGGICLAG